MNISKFSSDIWQDVGESENVFDVGKKEDFFLNQSVCFPETAVTSERFFVFHFFLFFSLFLFFWWWGGGTFHLTLDHDLNPLNLKTMFHKRKPKHGEGPSGRWSHMRPRSISIKPPNHMCKEFPARPVKKWKALLHFCNMWRAQNLSAH